MMNLEQFENFYFIGIGGIGMSALARYFKSIGKNVSGYDRTETKLTSALISEGIEISFQDEITERISSLKPEKTLVIYTPAVKTLGILDDFQQRNFTILKRAKVLGMITDETKCIAVAGTHGKTTTSSLVAHLCHFSGLSFSCFLGGISENFQSNFIYTGNEFSVVEADEYDRSFLNLHPDFAIVTSTDADHLDIYGDKATIEQSFKDFAALVPEKQKLFVRKGLEIGRESMTYAVNEEADFYSDNLRMEDDFILFDFHTKGETVKDFKWQIPGIHNVENATVAIALLYSLGVDFQTLKSGLLAFKGIKRRYTKHRFESGKIYIDDYAHHPTELDAVIGSIRNFYPEKKLLVAFQPHLFSRTRDFAEGFAKSLENCEELLLLDIYPARELQENFPGITSDWLLEKINLEKKETAGLQEAFEKIQQKDFDILLTVGAGNIDTLYDGIVEWLGKN
ncbi:UDP-N-acetylmuramate--L-alanine ligase [Cruoricaptor ignavus]|uniref:UDP-N-acetylmuramate--L-alanine ligase n=1 Tax=Cruoricaptor ignavus TaxID=1118202 RepID=A0A7M1T2P8_9FLAO|nr:UDP-N-acetylmuramate--L-alanine ligase [Cruoricaptor ignavus]QOR73212.1 UDP-N-acetylmuramate--L-alanine ligase [Cruoricaptor ignavus]